MHENFSRELPNLSGAAVRGEAVAGHEAHFARLTLIRASGDEELIEAVKMGKVSIHAALLQAIGATPVAGSSTDWRIYHGTLSKCADMLDNMADNDALVDVPNYLGEKLAALASVSPRAADAPSEPSEQIYLALNSLYEMTMRYAISDKDYGYVCNAAIAIKAYEESKSRAADALDSQPTDLKAVHDFLMGESALEGVQFGEKHPTKAGAHWWRLNLRAALAKG